MPANTGKKNVISPRDVLATTIEETFFFNSTISKFGNQYCVLIPAKLRDEIQRYIGKRVIIQMYVTPFYSSYSWKVRKRRKKSRRRKRKRRRISREELMRIEEQLIQKALRELGLQQETQEENTGNQP